MAAVWQRVVEAPLRQTQHGTFFKRDRERIEDDPVVSGPISDAFEPLPDMALLWIALATSRRPARRGARHRTGRRRAAGVLGRERRPPPADGRHPMARAPRVARAGRDGRRGECRRAGLAAPPPGRPPLARPARLTTNGSPSTTSPSTLDRLAPGWHHPTLPHPNPVSAPADRAGVLASILLGPAYQLGLVRTAEEDPSGRRVVQLTPLGRYVLALGPPPRAQADLRAFPLRPAELRGHRLPAGPHARPDRRVQPVRPLVADRLGPRAEADARVGLSGARRRPHARGDDRPARHGTARGRSRRASPTPSRPGPRAASG